MRPLRILIAPNSFKSSANADEAAEAFESGVLHFSRIINRQCDIRKVPICDGGTGFSTILARTQFPQSEKIEIECDDPLGRRRKSFYFSDGKTAIIESAQSIGLALLQRDEQNPLFTSSRGLGQVIEHAVRKKHDRIIVGFGDTATSDCGIGLMYALGARFFDSSNSEIVNPTGQDLGNIFSVDLSTHMLSDFQGHIDVACNLSSIAAGKSSTALVYSKQKGASAEQAQLLFEGITKFTELIERKIGKPDLGLLPGSGAAGGVGFAMAALSQKCRFQYSFEISFSAVDLDHHLRWADVVITGEGLFDKNSIKGKAPVALALRSKCFNTPSVGIVGSVESGIISRLIRSGFEVVEPLSDQRLNLEHYISNFSLLAKDATVRGLLKIWPLLRNRQR